VDRRHPVIRVRKSAIDEGHIDMIGMIVQWDESTVPAYVEVLWEDGSKFWMYIDYLKRL